MTTQPKYLMIEVDDPRDTDPDLNPEDLIIVTMRAMERCKINSDIVQQYLNECLRVESDKIREVTERWVTVRMPI